MKPVYAANGLVAEDFVMSITPTAETVPRASMRAGFSWTFPGAPIRINIPLALISRLRAELDQLENSDSRIPGAEAGGVLVGYQATPATVEIDDYLWVLSEQRPGSRFSLDTAVLERLRSEHSTREGNAGRPSLVVGYFRTQSKDNLRLRDEEIGFVREHFRDPTDVVLLIQTSTKPYTAGFFFWMESSVFAPFSFMDFPLDAEILGLQTKPPSTAISARQPAGRMEMPLPFPVAANEYPATPPEIELSEMEPVGVPLRRLVAPGAVIALLALAGLSAYAFRDRWLSGPGRQEPAPVAAFPLQLEVEAQGGGLNVRWNPQSAPVTQAREGHLVILEGGKQPQIVPLDPQQLTSGHVYYRSSAERLQFQLEIVDNSGSVARESVLALSSAMPPPVATIARPPQAGNASTGNTSAASMPAGNAPSQTRRVVSVPIPSTGAGALQLAKAAPAPPNRQPAPRVFTPPPSSRGQAEPIPAITLDQPPAIPSNTTLPPSMGLPTTLSKLPAPPAIQPPVNQPPATRQVRIGGNVQAANLIRRVTPLYPPAAKLAHIQGDVRFTALIGKDGAVRNLQVIGGSPTLIQAALDAVKQWIYRPTLLNGEPVEVITQIDVLFTLNP